MHLIIQAPFDTPRHVQGRLPPGRTLGAMCAPHTEHVTACQVNAQFVDDWQGLEPGPDDTVTLYVATAEPISLTTIVTAVIVSLITTAVGIGLSYLIRALTPTETNTAGKPEQIFGIAGQTNTSALGTPLFLVYGTRRVFGQIINTRVSISADGRTTMFGILYFMGEGPIQGITDPEINDTPVGQFTGVTWDWRAGDGNAVMLAGFDTVSSVWSDGRSLAVGVPLVYTTRGSDVLRATLILATPFLFDQDSKGNHDQASHTFTIEAALVSDGLYGEVAGSPLVWTDNADSARFRMVPIELGSADAWLIRITLTATTNESGAVPSLFNVQEDSPGSLLYPDSALLSFQGIASSQIQSFEAMRGSALVQGRLIGTKPLLVAGVWDGTSYETAWSHNRAWVLWDYLLDARVGQGIYFDESLLDVPSFVAAANYWDEVAYGSLLRDQCDLLINERRAAQDWINVILQEGRALLVPSGGLLKLVIDQADTPGLLYSVPGNVVAESVTRSQGSGEGHLINRIVGQFPDAEQAYRLQPWAVDADGTELEPRLERLVTIYTLTHIHHAYWLLRYELLRARLIQRHYRWQSPQTALVSEALDTVSLSYETPNFARGVSGFCPAGSTTTRLLLDRSVTLAAATTYSLILRHQADNTVERTTVSTAAGTWGAIAPTVAFTTAPATGDLWALGVQTTALVTVVIESIQHEGDAYVVTASEYQADVHATPEPPASPGAVSGLNRAPLPLWDASVRQVVAMDDTGVSRVMLTFSITPQMQSHAGQVPEALPSDPDQIRLSDEEPYGRQVMITPPIAPSFLDHFYTTEAIIRIIEGTGIGQARTLTDYTNTQNPAARYAVAYVTPDWDTPPDTTSVYLIEWPSYNEVTGFLLEESPLAGDPFLFDWVPVGRFPGLTVTMPARSGTYDTAFRFTPFTAQGVLSQHPGGLGRWVAVGVVTGDVDGPGDAMEAAADGGG